MRRQPNGLTREKIPTAISVRFLTVNYTATVAVKDNPSQPAAFALHENFPNPCAASSQTLLRYGLPQRASVKLVIYNLLGEKSGRSSMRLKPREKNKSPGTAPMTPASKWPAACTYIASKPALLRLRESSCSYDKKNRV
jgi:hypothetical protein